MGWVATAGGMVEVPVEKPAPEAKPAAVKPKPKK